MQKNIFRIFFIVFLFVFALALNLSAQSRNRRHSDTVHNLTQDEAMSRWSEFLASRPSKDYYFEFTLEHLPRKSDSTEYKGVCLGKYLSPRNFIYRIDICKKSDSSVFKKFIIASKNGIPSMKVYDGKELKEYANFEEMFVPLLDGLIYSPFDLFMPYKSWRCEYAGAGRAARAVHFYDLFAPENFSAQKANLSKVRVALSREFNAPFQTEYFDFKGELSRVVNLDSVKKIDENWIVQCIEVVDKTSRDKDKITIENAKFFNISDFSIFEKDFNTSAFNFKIGE